MNTEGSAHSNDPAPPAGRVMIIGLDSADMNLLGPYIDKGLMPNLAGFLRDGASGPLKTVFPAVSFQAWTSLATGKAPSSHGILGIRKPFTGKGYDAPLLDSRSIRRPRIWDFLERRGMRSIALNLPVSWPPDKINGYMVCGMLVPGIKSEFTWPHALREEILAAIPGYMLDVNWLAYSEDRIPGFFDDLDALVDAHGRAAELLAAKGEWHFLLIVFYTLDRLIHCLWKFLDPAYPGHDPARGARFRSRFEKHLALIDSWVGRLAALAGGDGAVMIVSDHGAGPLLKHVYTDNFLVEKGFMAFRRAPRPLLQRLGFPAKALPLALLESIPPTKKLFGVRREIVWNRTVAYTAPQSEEGIYINLKGREEFGIVERHDYEKVRSAVVSALKEMRGPDGAPVVDSVFLREEIHKGPFAESAPDILFVMRGLSYKAEPGLNAGGVIQSPEWNTGSHREMGIFAAKGRGVRPGAKVAGAGIMDVMPTAMYLLGAPVPDDLDGSILESAIDEETLRSRAPVFEPLPAELAAKHNPAAAPEEEPPDEEVLRRLKGLGYI